MAKHESLADILQAIGFSELIESFEGEDPLQDLQTLLTDNTIIQKLVPDLQRDEFVEKVEQFFKNHHDGGISDEESEIDELERARQENVDLNNIVQERQLKSVNSVDKYFSIENVDIKDILSNTFEGKQILAWHDAKSFLKPGQRKRLVHHVIAGVMSVCNRQLHESDFKILSMKIVELFKKECALVYYEPRVRKNQSDTGKAKKSKGKLLNKYKNLKKTIVQLQIAEKVPELVVDREDYEEELTENIEESIEWLRNQEEPWNETVNHWKKTASYRQAQIDNDFKNKISSTYKEWPILKCPKGYLLILEDFSYRKFTKEDPIDTFKNFFDKAVLAKPFRKDEYVDLLQGMLLKPDLNEDDGTLIRLMLLCILMPSTARIAIGERKRWKPSSVESFEGIVARIKVYGDISKVRSARHQFARSRKLTVQPYLIVVEENDYQVQSTYLCIDEILYEMPSVLKALDVCFKSFHVLKADYTAQSYQIWLLLQLGLYKFRTAWDESLIDVNELLNDMGILLPSLETK